MRYYTEEEIRKAKEIDLLSYLKENEPSELVKLAGNTYSTRTNSSLKISNGKWMWWSHGFGGYTALDYLIKVRGLSFPKAVGMILESMDGAALIPEEKKEVRPKKLLLPEKSSSNDRVIKYLTGRGIHPALVRACIDKDLLYESLPYHNCVFIGYDEEGIAKYAYYRSTNKERIMGEAAGSDKRYSFRIDQDSKVLHVFESAIDLLSFATLQKVWTGKWHKESMLSLGGIYVSKEDEGRIKIPKGLEHKLKTDPGIETIRVHLDADSAGYRASEQIVRALKSSYDIRSVPPRCGKDMNDELFFLMKKLPDEKERRDVNGKEFRS